MKKIAAGHIYEEQVLMRREVSGIKTQMQKIVDHARSGNMQQMEAVMLSQQMQQMAQRVLTIRSRCQHVWTIEYSSKITLDNDTKVSYNMLKVCTICESCQEHT